MAEVSKWDERMAKRKEEIAREEFEARIKESEARAREEARTSFGYWNSLGSGKPKIEILPSLSVGYALKLADLEKAYQETWAGTPDFNGGAYDTVTVDPSTGADTTVIVSKARQIGMSDPMQTYLEMRMNQAARQMNEGVSQGLFGPLTSQRAVAKIPPAKPALKLPCMETGVRKITLEEDD